MAGVDRKHFVKGFTVLKIWKSSLGYEPRRLSQSYFNAILNILQLFAIGLFASERL